MSTRSTRASYEFVSILAILVVVLPLLSEPLEARVRRLVAPANCSGGNITLVSGQATVTIENVQISNASASGCAVSGKMRVQVGGNNKGNISIAGSVDSYDNFNSSSIGYFDLNVAGLTLKVYSPKFFDGSLRLTSSHIKIPNAWGGLEAQIPSTPVINENGLEMARFALPSISAANGIGLDLSGALRLVSGGYEIDADGTLGLPDIGKTSSCAISVGVTLYADALGNAVMEIHTRQDDNRSAIARPPSTPLDSYYLPLPESLSPHALQAQEREAIQSYQWAVWEEGRYDHPLLSSDDAPDVPVAVPSPEPEALREPAGLALHEIRAEASCSRGIPIGQTGFQLTGVRGTISLRPDSQFVSLGITVETLAKVGGFSALRADADTTFQWKPEFAMSISGQLWVLSMFMVGEAEVSISESDGFRTEVFMRGIYVMPPVVVPWEITTSIHAWTKYGKFHFTGSGTAGIGVSKGRVWTGCVPLPCGTRWCYKWVLGVKVWYPCGVKLCDVCTYVPPDDWFVGKLYADFGEFTGVAYGFKAYVSVLGYTIGVFVNDKGEVAFGNVDKYKLVDSMQFARARQAWRAAQRSGDAGFGDDAFTFLSEDNVLVHFDLPLADRYRAPLASRDAISQVNVITETDTLFSVKSDTPLTVSLVSPDGFEITPENYRDSPGGYTVGYQQVITYNLERASSEGEQVYNLAAAFQPTLAVAQGSKQEQAAYESRWRFIPTASDPALWRVDVKLDGTEVFTNVWLTGTQRIDYVPVDPGLHSVQIVPVGAAQPALVTALNVVTGTDYTVLTVDEAFSGTLALGEAISGTLVISDDNRMPSAFGSGRVRVVNVAPVTGTLDVYLGDWSFPGVAHQQATDYQLVRAGHHSLSVPPVYPWSLILSGNASGDKFGSAVANAGDVNGDGYDDVIVGASTATPTGALTTTGQAYVYHGGAAGLAATPAITFSGDYHTPDAFGFAVSTAGDVNDDGYDDVVVGAPGVYSGQGQAYLYLGSSGGLSDTFAFAATGQTAGDSLGYTVAGAGDVNKDGYDDVIVSAWEAASNRGQVYLYLGNSGGLSDTVAFTATGQADADWLGDAMAGVGDVNGDGYDDVLIGARGADAGGSDRGQAYLYLGGSGGLSAAAAFTATGRADFDYLGWSVAGAGDVNNDGYDDVLIGAPRADAGGIDTGQAYLHLGGSSGLSAVPAFTITGQADFDFLGSVAGAGDVNNDGYDDVIVAAYGVDAGGYDRGRACLYLGGSEGLSAAPVFSATGQADMDWFGWSVAGAGGVNGDGWAKLIVGAGDLDQDSGWVYVYDVTLVEVDEGDVQTVFVTGLGDPLAVMATLDERYKVFTETQYVVDQAPPGNWSVKLVGDTDGAQFVVGAVAAPDPPVVEDLSVDASDLVHTQVSWRLLSDYLPVSIGIYANDGPISETMVVTESLGLTNTLPYTYLKTVPLYEGEQVANIEITQENAVQGEVVSATVDLSILESGNYKLWVRAEDGVSPPVQGYVWGTRAAARAAGLDPTLNHARVAVEGYDPLAQLAGAVEIVIDHTPTFSPNWTTAITSTVNPRFWIEDEHGELQETLIRGLFVEFAPHPHPDVDSYVLEVSELGQTHVLTTGKTVYHHYDEGGQPIGAPVPYAIFNGLSPKDAYTIRIGAYDLGSGLVSWSQEHEVSVPLGDFELRALQSTIERPAGQEVVTATLALTMTDDLFSDVGLYLERYNLPLGIAVREIVYESPARTSQTGASITLLARVALTVTADVPPASYLLPIVAHSGELQRKVNITLLVGEPQETIVEPDDTQPVVIQADLPLPSCATAITVTIPPGTFAAQTTVQFRQGSSNVADWRGMRFAGSRFDLQARDNNSGSLITSHGPVSLRLAYDPACLGGLQEGELHLRLWDEQVQWSTDGVACTPDPPADALTCSLSRMGAFALFEQARVYLPLVVKQ